MKPRALVHVILFACLLVGCATRQAPVHSTLPPSEEMRAAFGTMELQPIEPREFVYTLPLTKGRGAGRGAWIGFKTGGQVLEGAVAPAGGAVLVVGAAIATSVIGLPVGAIAGAVSGMSTGQIAIAEQEVLELHLETAAPTLLREELVVAAWERAGRVFINPPTNGSPTSCPAPDTLFDIRLTTLTLTEKGRVNPPLKLELGAELQVSWPLGDGSIYTYRSRYSSVEGRRFAEWSINSASALRAELELGCRVLAEDIVDQLFLRPSNALPVK